MSSIIRSTNIKEHLRNGENLPPVLLPLTDKIYSLYSSFFFAHACLYSIKLIHSSFPSSFSCFFIWLDKRNFSFFEGSCLEMTYNIYYERRGFIWAKLNRPRKGFEPLTGQTFQTTSLRFQSIIKQNLCHQIRKGR